MGVMLRREGVEGDIGDPNLTGVDVDPCMH